MLNGISIPYEVADDITISSLKVARQVILEEMVSNAFNYDKEHEKENMRNNMEALFAIERVLTYFAGDKWNDN